MPRTYPQRSRRRRERHTRPAETPAASAAATLVHWERFFPLVLPVAALAAYHNTFTVPFLFDDVGIAESPELRALSLRSLVGTTRPLVQLALALNYAVGGLNVFGYHVFNLAIHVLAATALFGIVARTLRTSRLRERWGSAAASVALAVSLIWTVHPLQTESVTYVVQRAESMMALCYLLTLYCVIRGAASSHAARWYAAAVVACALGMLCKPVMVTAPIAVLLYDRVFRAGSWERAWHDRRALYLALAATWTIPAWLLTAENESAATAGFRMQAVSTLDYVRSQPGVILHYLRLVFWPRGLVLDYGWPVANGAVAVALPALIVAGLALLTVWAFRRSPEIGFLGAVFFLTLAPSSSVIPIQDLAFEHRMYLPLAALAALAVISGRLLIRRAALDGASERRLAAAVTVTLVVVLTMLTVARNGDYRSAIAMWTDVVTKRPENARGRNNLGDALFEAGNVDAAVRQLRTALELDPRCADAHNNLGRALAVERKLEEAEGHYREALRLMPENAEAHNNLGIVLVDRRNYPEAQTHYSEALRLKPSYAEAENNLGVALTQQGKYDDATTHYLAALHLKPDYAEAYSNLGNALARQGKLAEAVSRYRQALRISPDYAEVHYNLGLALAGLGKQDEAAAHTAEAVRLKPDLRSTAR
jgi:Flp pilus assembly protein TadD